MSQLDETGGSELAESPWAGVAVDNTNFVFIRPSASTPAVCDLVNAVFKEHKLNVVRSGEVSTADVKKENVLDTHFGVQTRFDRRPAAKTKHFQDIMDSFEEHLGDSYTNLAKQGRIYNATECLAIFKLSPAQLFHHWEAAGDAVPITSGLEVKRIPALNSAYIINGYFPFLKETLEMPGRAIRWFVVAWPEEQLSWAAFMEQVVGAEDPFIAADSSVRRRVASDWSALGLTAPPTSLDNVLYAAKGPLEALAMRLLWLKTEMPEDELGRVVNERYGELGILLCQQWSQNNRISLNDEPFRPAFDVCANFQTSDLLDTVEQNFENDEAYLKFKEKKRQERAAAAAASAAGLTPEAEFAFLSQTPHGLALFPTVYAVLKDDALFQAAATERRLLRRGEPIDSAAVAQCEGRMEARNQLIAAFMVKYPKLDQLLDGVTVADHEPAIISDWEFCKYEREMAELAAGQPSSSPRTAELEAAMKDRAKAIVMATQEYAFLAPMPEGLRLFSVVFPVLREDVEFRSGDSERKSLMKEPEKFALRIGQLELRLNERNLAVAAHMKRYGCMEQFPEGLRLFPTVFPVLREDPRFKTLDAERDRLLKAGAPDADVRAVVAAMDERSLAVARVMKKYPFLDQMPLGVPLHQIIDVLEGDDTFSNLELERKGLSASPAQNARRIVQLQARLNDRARDVAGFHTKYGYLHQSPGGTPLFSLQADLHDDDMFGSLERLRDDALRKGDTSSVDTTTAAMNDRVSFIVRLKTEYDWLHPKPHGIALGQVIPWLEQDDCFRGIVGERKSLRAAKSDKGAVQAVEARGDQRSHVIAATMKEYPFVEPRLHGVFLADLLAGDLQQDTVFVRCREELATLNRSGGTAARKKGAETALARRYADVALCTGKYSGLDQRPCGKWLPDVIQLMLRDDVFSSLDAKRDVMLAAGGTPKTPEQTKAVVVIEKEMDSRVLELMSASEYAFLTQEPEGLSLTTTVLPMLKRDHPFVTLDARRKTLKAQSGDAGDAYEDLCRQMDARNIAFAKALTRYPFLEQQPRPTVGLVDLMPLVEDDPTFLAEHEAYLRCADDAARNDRIKNMNERVRRYAGVFETFPFLKARPAAVPSFLAVTALESSPEFASLTKEYQAKPSPALESKISDSVHAKALRMYPFIKGPNEVVQRATSLLRAHDPAFCAADDEYRQRSIDNFKEFSPKLRALEADMQRGVDQLIKALGDFPFLEPVTEGVLLTRSSSFLSKCTDFGERLASWRAGGMQGDGEPIAAMRDMHHRLVQAVREYPFMDQVFSGLLFADLLAELAEDAEWGRLKAQHTELLRGDPGTRQAVEGRMAEKAQAVAAARIAERAKQTAYSFLDQKPHGLALFPTVFAVLRHDPEFKALDAAPSREEHHAAMNARNLAVAYAMKTYPYVDQIIGGRLLESILPAIEGDTIFTNLLRQREGAAGAERQALESLLNERAHAIALLVERYGCMEQFPEGLRLFPTVFPVLREDPRFKTLDAERDRLLKAGAPDAEVRAVVTAMDERSLAVARVMKKYPFLDQMPDGAMLVNIADMLEQDPTFNGLLEERTGCEDDEDRALVDELLNKRVAEVAGAARLLKDEYNFLDAAPEGIPLCLILADAMSDEAFATLDADRKMFTGDGAKSNRVKLLESEMNDRCYAIARTILRQRRGDVSEDDGYDEDEARRLLEIAAQRAPHHRRSFIRIAGEAAQDPDRWVDVDFNMRHEYLTQWIRISDLYAGPEVGANLLPDELHTGQFEHGLTPECFFLVSLSALLPQPDLIRRLFVSKHVRKDGRYTFQFYKWDRWVRVEVDDQIPMVRNDVRFIASPTKHWWPLLLEKAYAKFYGGYHNILNGSTVEAMHDMTAMPVINAALAPNLRLHLNVQSRATWEALAKAQRANAYAMTVVTHPESSANSNSWGLKECDVYGVRAIHVLPPDEGSDFSPPDDVLSDVLLELYNPHRGHEYTGPFCAGDARWTPSRLAAVRPSLNSPHVIYVPVEAALQACLSMPMCYCMALEPRPFYFSGHWSSTSAGGNANFCRWRSNPIYPIQNTTDKPVTVVVQLKQPDQRERGAPLRETAISYTPVGITLAEQLPLPSEDDEPVLTHLLTTNTCRLAHNGIYLCQRDVSNEVTLAPGRQCYVVPSTLEAGVSGSFMLAVFVPAGLADDAVVMRPVSSFPPLRMSFECQEKERKRLTFEVSLPRIAGITNAEDIHVLLRQDCEGSKAGTVGDKVTDHYFGVAVTGPDGQKLTASMASAMNARELAVVFRAQDSGSYTIAVLCAKAATPVPCTVLVYSLPTVAWGLRAHGEQCPPPRVSPARKRVVSITA